MFIMVDGIDGSGKSTVVEAWKEYLAAQGNAIFDLRSRWKETGEHPALEELRSYDFIFSSEPTYSGIGRVIREELIRNGTFYPPEAIAEAYSLDRLILYTKLFEPLLCDNKCIIQDRGVSTSLCYQPLTGNLTVDFVKNLPGNALALRHRPDYLLIITASPKLAISRLSQRITKKDNVIFEKLNFQTQAAERFVSDEFRQLFEDRGTKVVYLSGEGKADKMNGEAIKILQQILNI